VAKVRNGQSHYSTFTRENNVTLVQSFIHNDLKAMVGDIMSADDVKLGAFIEWSIAIGVNKANELAGRVERFDETRLHYANHTRKSSRVTINAMRDENAELREMIAQQAQMMQQMMQQLNAKKEENAAA